MLLEGQEMRIKPIRTSADLHDAKAALRRLIVQNSNGEFDDDIEVLSTLIEKYEETEIRLTAPTAIEAIKFRMQELGLSPRQLEPYIGSRARVSEVLSGKRSLSIDMIRALHDGLGIPFDSLISGRTRSQSAELSVTSFAVKKLNSYGIMLKPNEIESLIGTALAPALLRKTRSHRATLKTDQSALTLWQAAVLKKAEASSANVPFRLADLSLEAIRQIAILSSKPNGPSRAICSLREKGITTIILPPLPGTFLDGAVMLDRKERPVIGLTLRHDRVDNFWFTLLHEVAHVCLHYGALLKDRSAFIDDIEINSEDLCEKQADDLARRSLIPDSVLTQVVWSEFSTLDDITAVASRARVHIAVVAGRWQREHGNYRKFARIIERDTLRRCLLKPR